METFWSTLKTKLVYRTSWRTRDSAKNATFDKIETSHQRCVSNGSSYGVREGSGRVVDGVMLQAVMQLAEHEVEQPT